MPKSILPTLSLGRVTATQRRAYRKAFIARGWTQNQAGREADCKDSSAFAKWLAGKIVNNRLRQRVDAALERTPPSDEPRRRSD